MLPANAKWEEKRLRGTVFRSIRPKGMLDRVEEVDGLALEGLVAQHLRALKSFKEDYPESNLVFLYNGKERLKKESVLCVPCEDFLRQLHPDRKLFSSSG